MLAIYCFAFCKTQRNNIQNVVCWISALRLTQDTGSPISTPYQVLTVLWTDVKKKTKLRHTRDINFPPSDQGVNLVPRVRLKYHNFLTSSTEWGFLFFYFVAMQSLHRLRAFPLKLSPSSECVNKLQGKNGRSKRAPELPHPLVLAVFFPSRTTD